MYEVELKIRADHDPVREQLAAKGADRRGIVEQEDVYYQHPTRDFGETDDDGSATVVTYKGPLVEAASKTRREYETGVADGETMARALEALGFERFETVRKRRERFDYGDYTVALDAVESVGDHVEVETEADAVEPAREGAVELLVELGLDPDDQIRTSYLGLLLDGGGDTRE